MKRGMTVSRCRSTSTTWYYGVDQRIAVYVRVLPWVVLTDKEMHLPGFDKAGIQRDACRHHIDLQKPGPGHHHRGHTACK